MFLYGIDIDVVSASPDLRDEYSHFFRGNAIWAQSVTDMVQKIQERLWREYHGGIKRLRLFGHAAPAMQIVGHIHRNRIEQLSRGLDPTNIHYNDLIKIITVERRTTGSTRLLNEERLADIKGKFVSGGWLELHGCYIAGGTYGETFLTYLAEFYGVPVKSGIEGQVIGGGYEGAIVVGYPDGRIERRSRN